MFGCGRSLPSYTVLDVFGHLLDATHSELNGVDDGNTHREERRYCSWRRRVTALRDLRQSVSYTCIPVKARIPRTF
jgi:hypothetical protein